MGTRLLSLTLGKTRYFGGTPMLKLAEALANKPAPVLREVRLIGSALGLETGLENLTETLRVNHTLAVLQLPDPSSFWGRQKLE